MCRSWYQPMAIVPAILGCLALTSAHPHPDSPGDIATHETLSWTESSLSWVNRQTCRWLSDCETSRSNVEESAYRTLHSDQQTPLSQVQPHDLPLDSTKFWTSGLEEPEKWSKEEHLSRKIPQYVYDYTPYVHLFSGEQFWPCDIAEHLVHTSPYANYTLIRSMENDRTLENLDELNQYGRFAYLKSEDNVEERPDWLGGSSNIPRSPEDVYDESHDRLLKNPPLKPGRVPGRKRWNEFSRNGPEDHSKPSNRLQERGGHSSAPAVLIVVPKEDGVVDAFWFYFYSYNLGNKVFNIRFGNHVGDWEHSMVRFRNGTPEAVYISEHGAGEAYAYHAVEKYGKRPVIYSATGTHAIYATPGLHPYVLPWGLLHDQTDKGPLWDPTLNHHAYVYNYTSRHLKSSAQTPHAPVSWFNFRGHWGDKMYPMSDKRQYRFWGQYHYVSGPIGPRFKNLGRKKVCQRMQAQCVIRHWLGEGGDDGEKKLPGSETGDEVLE
ncbi:hypothetical protein D6D10_02698 [Aureobasidium pullulans]|uniref:Vacuolar protein sorting-associated protein 62 n=2 Tax=Aureobasidium pullulans TaxID=5580 RepID=A0A4S9F2L5_AURPU|nr:hypothetical protein D6D10_02698 [Aureobasidium pullulans]